MPRYRTALMAGFLCLFLPGCLIGESPLPTPQTTPTTQAATPPRASPRSPATSVTHSPVPPATPRAPVDRDMFVSTPGVGAEYAAILEPLGRAYAEDQHLTFKQVQTSV